MIAAVVAMILLIGSGIFLYRQRSRPKPGRVSDEGASGTAAFVSPSENYFHDMDGTPDLSLNEIQGRNLWMVHSGGNDRFWDWVARQSGGRFDLLKIISSYNPDADPRAAARKERLKLLYPARHSNRFEMLGLMNEPCYEESNGPDGRRYGLWLDNRRLDCTPDPFADPDKYPGVLLRARGRELPLGSFYGAPSGVIGLRLFINPDFNSAAARRWDPARYYNDPSYYSSPDLVRPFRVGVTCAFCHAGFRADHLPEEIASPKWENFSSVAGAQYLRMDRIGWEQNTSSFLWQLLHASRPGTIDTSFAATDQVFNPRAPNPLWGLPARMTLARSWGEEKLGGGSLRARQISDYVAAGPLIGFFEPPDRLLTPRLDVSAMDSAGILEGVARWFADPGMFSEETHFHFNAFAGGKPQSPLTLPVLRGNSAYWRFTEESSVDVVRFLMSVGASPHWTGALDKTAAGRGKAVFADRCASCHSSKAPAPPPIEDPGSCGNNYLACWNRYWAWTQTPGYQQAMQEIAAAPDFLENNFLSNDLRVPLPLVGTNACAAMGGNGGAGELWDNFTSQTYKTLPSAGVVTWYHPETGEPRKWMLPAGGRGYLRPTSLIAVWNTAPLLSTNSVGRFEASVEPEARMAAFVEAMEELLWPEKRERDSLHGDKVPGMIPRTTESSSLRVPSRFVPDELVKVLDGPFSFWPRFRALDEVAIGPIPAGTPVGLLASLNLLSDKSLPLLQRLKKEPLARLTDALLELSTCPDLVVNRGHYFGTGLDGAAPLTDQQKRDLIEFMKLM